jgi:hypothetical protein
LDIFLIINNYRPLLSLSSPYQPFVTLFILLYLTEHSPWVSGFVVSY